MAAATKAKSKKTNNKKKTDFHKKLVLFKYVLSLFGIDTTTDEKSENYVVRAKTGWEGKYGWYVGYVETKNDVWFFALNIDTKTKEDLAKRKALTLEALKTKGIID